MKITRKDQELFDIELDGQIIGCGSMIEAEEDDEAAYLERLDIDEGHQNKGYGTKALRLLRKVYGPFFTAPDSEDAQRFYDRVGCEMRVQQYSDYGFAVDQGFGVYEF